jgi:hypothetical protein
MNIYHRSGLGRVGRATDRDANGERQSETKSEPATMKAVQQASGSCQI